MKRIGLTQRVEVVSAYNERRDCLDQNWMHLILELGMIPIPLPNIKDTEAIAPYLNSMALNGLILTGGNDLSITGSKRAAPERDYFESEAINYCLDHNIPILGVCRGMQMLNDYFGGELTPVQNHVGSTHKVTLKDDNSYEVNSYHDWGISEGGLAKGLVAVGHSDDGLVEYCKHKISSVTAMMWHPERYNVDAAIGKQIIQETFL